MELRAILNICNLKKHPHLAMKSSSKN